MIKKTLVFSLLFLLVYSVVIMKFGANTQIAQHQWQSNVIKAENFLYNSLDTVQNVIVGSSLASRLIMDSLSGYYNLSFSGQGIFDGLNILSHQNKLPKNIFIETNVVFRKEDKNFTSSLTNPVYNDVRKAIPAFRDGKQPLGIAGQAVAYLVGGIISRLKKAPSNIVAAGKQDEVFKTVLKGEISNFSKEPSLLTVKESFDNLERYVSMFRKRGVNIIFFEMPVNSQLCDLPESVTVRQNFYSRFPVTLYRYIPQPSCDGYVTTDGLHLNKEEASRYTSYFRNMAGKCSQK